MTTIQYLLGAFSGGLVGLTLGLFGGGGSILAVPLMVYLVGVRAPHVAVGTSAVAVAVNAAGNLFVHARQGHVVWRCAALFSVAGIAGAYAGSLLGKSLDGQKLLFLFALLMGVIGLLMFRARHAPAPAAITCGLDKAPKVMGYGAAAGGLSGFFGIGGGFLIVPSLVASTGMPVISAIGSSLLAVVAFAVTTAVSYSISGLVDWPLALVFIGGGAVGGLAGTAIARVLAGRGAALNTSFAILVVGVALYTAIRSAAAML